MISARWEKSQSIKGGQLMYFKTSRERKTYGCLRVASAVQYSYLRQSVKMGKQFGIWEPTAQIYIYIIYSVKVFQPSKSTKRVSAVKEIL